MIEFILNNKSIKTDLSPGMVMLDFIRYQENLKGTKIGCREGDCGACTVLVGESIDGKIKYRSMTSCLMPIGNAHAKHIVTVEGINALQLNPVQQAIVDKGGTQCGFCTVGFVMSLVGFCMSEKNLNYENAIAAIDGNICRCTGYKSLERAAQTIVEKFIGQDQENSLIWLVNQHYIPSYFLEIPARIQSIIHPKKSSENKIKVAGGTDLYVQNHEGMPHARLDFLIDDSLLKGIKLNGNKISIGASTTVEDLRSNSILLHHFPNLKKYLKLVSSTPIRNMASVGGNFVNASPIGDMTIFFLALNASLVLKKGENRRTILLKDFYKGYKKLDKLPEEIIESISFEVPTAATYFNFEKVSKRTHLDIASVNSALWVELKNNKINNVHLAIGGVYAFPKYLEKTSSYLIGKEISDLSILNAAEILQTEISPISDARGTAAYKRLLARQLFFVHFIELFPNLINPETLLQLETI